MDDEFMRALDYTTAAELYLAELRSDLESLAEIVADLLKDAHYRGNMPLLIDRGNRQIVRKWYTKKKEVVLHNKTIGWQIGSIESTIPHIRELYLLGDGSLGIDAIGPVEDDAARICRKARTLPYPDIVQFTTDQIKTTAELENIASHVAGLLIMYELPTQSSVALVRKLLK